MWIFDDFFKSGKPTSEELSLRGYSQIIEENYDRALSYFEQAIALDPADAYARNGMGIAQSRLDQDREAHRIVQNGPLRSTRNSRRHLNALPRPLRKIGIEEEKPLCLHEAIEALNTALSMDPDDLVAFKREGGHPVPYGEG